MRANYRSGCFPPRPGSDVEKAGCALEGERFRGLRPSKNRQMDVPPKRGQYISLLFGDLAGYRVSSAASLR
jgi:hypothetical protein